jgi:hypothetical protein
LIGDTESRPEINESCSAAGAKEWIEKAVQGRRGAGDAVHEALRRSRRSVLSTAARTVSETWILSGA